MCVQNYSKLIYYSMCSRVFPPFSQEDTRTSTLNTLNFALRWKPSTRAELKPRKESTATARSFLTANQITIRYGNTFFFFFYNTVHLTPHSQFFLFLTSSKTHLSPADIRECYIWHQNIFSTYIWYSVTFTAHQSPYIGLKKKGMPSWHPTEKNTLSCLTFLPSPPLAKWKACGCFTSQRTIVSVGHVMGYLSLHNRVEIHSYSCV